MGRPAKTTKRRLGGREKTDRLHLTGIEVEKLIDATRASATKPRPLPVPPDVAARPPGLRVKDPCNLNLDQVNLESRVLHVARLTVKFQQVVHRI